MQFMLADVICQYHFLQVNLYLLVTISVLFIRKWVIASVVCTIGEASFEFNL